MKVLVVSCVFPPEPVVSGKTSIHVAEELAARGHEVKVITSFPSKPAGVLYPGYSRRLYKRERAFTGFSVIRCFSFISSQSRLYNRFLENISFGVTSSWAVLFSRRYDVIYSNTWPVFATGLVFIAAQVRRTPMVITVQDVYPESLTTQGRALPQGLLMRCLRWWDGVIARGCRGVIVISERFSEIYRNNRRVPKEKIHVIPNWGEDRMESIEAERIALFRKAKNISNDARVFAYGGNIGVAAGVEILIRAVSKLKTTAHFNLLIAGEGSQLDVCRRMAGGEGDGRIFFHSPWRSEETILVLQLAEVLLLPTRGRQSNVSVPSKLISYWLAGKPVIAMAQPESDLAALIESTGGGWIVEPDRSDLLAAKIDEVLNLDPAELRQKGMMGKEFTKQNLSRKNCLPRVVAILEQAGRS